ncbi:MAG: hypothetical protein ACJ0UT_10335 [Candidatus Latescibacterota bacterium]
MVWYGGITGIGLVAIFFLYAFGDPRPRSVNESQIFGEKFAIPDVIPNGPYYRLRAEYFPMTNAVSKTNLLGKAWMVLFSDVVAEAGAQTVRLRLSHTRTLPLPNDKEGYLFLDSSIKGPAVSAVTPFMLRNAEDNVEMRLNTNGDAEARSGLISSLLYAMGSGAKASSVSVSIFAPGSVTGRQVLSSANTLLPVRDFSGRILGAIRIGVETRDGLLLPPDESEPNIREILNANIGSAERMVSLMHFVQSQQLPMLNGQGIKSKVSQVLETVAQNSNGSACREAIAELSYHAGISTVDASALVYLARFNKTAMEVSLCGDAQLAAALATSGIVDQVQTFLIATRPNKEAKDLGKKRASNTIINETAQPAMKTIVPSGRYVCLGLSGRRIAHHCKVLNAIAREWRGNAKFLHMTSSIRHIQINVGLEEPAENLSYKASRLRNRRDLLIHISLSDVENFACFRMTRENPDYFDVVVVMQEPGALTARRVDVFQFAFDSDGTIGRIRRRAAFPSDIDAARSLPENSRCRREFLDPHRQTIDNTINNYWRLPRY